MQQQQQQQQQHLEEDDHSLLVPSPAAPDTTSGANAEDTPASSFICAVCFRPCTKYLYYGARACLGCRAFFRRARAGNRFQTFRCLTGDGKCPVEAVEEEEEGGGDGSASEIGRRRKICAYCRHIKCLKVGMNPAWMLSDADREERRKRRKGQQQQQQQQQQSNSKEVVYVQGLRAAPEILFTAEELLQLQRIISHVNEIYLDALTSNLLVYRATARDIFDMSVYGARPGLAFIPGFQALKREAVLDIYQRFQDFSPIDPLDRRLLIEKNFPALFTMMVANYFHPEGFRVFLSRILGTLKKKQAENEAFERMAGNLEVLEVSGVPLTLSYEQVFSSPWLPNPAEEARHARLFDRIRLWGREDMPEKIRDTAMIVLLYLICILDSSGCPELRDAASVDQVHDGYVSLLCRYLRWSYGEREARRRLGNGVSVVALAQEAHHIMERAASNVAAENSAATATAAAAEVMADFSDDPEQREFFAIRKSISDQTSFEHDGPS